MIKLVRTNSENKDFVNLVNYLNDYLKIVDGDDNSFDSGDFIMFYGQAGNLPHYDTASQLLVNTPQYYSDSNFVFLTVKSS